MKKYSVCIEFKNGQDMQFETDTNILLQQPVNVNGAEMVMTKDEYGVNMAQVKRLEVVQIGHGKIGEIVNP